MGAVESGLGKLVPGRTAVSKNGVTKAGLPMAGAGAANNGVPERRLVKSPRDDFKTSLALALNDPCLPGGCTGAFFMAPACFKTPTTKDEYHGSVMMIRCNCIHYNSKSRPSHVKWNSIQFFYDQV
jgi:hypothetical protein